MPISEKPTLVIVGGGYSGTLTAVNILRTAASKPLRLVLIERQLIVGRGLAYRFRDDNFLLNVPAGNMSALADEPDHFVAYCQEIDPAFNGKSFVSRRLYGEYLEYTLAETEKKHPGILEKLTDEVVAIVPDAARNGFGIELAGGANVAAQQVVLALGHFPSKIPAIVPQHLHKYLVEPWDFSRLDSLDQTLPVAILGMGHTAIDALFRLTSCNINRKVSLLSRRGLLPYGHRINPNPPAAANYPEYLLGLPPSIRAYTRALRREIRQRETRGDNWRDVINELRPFTPQLWQGLPEIERRRFLSRIMPFWDIHRHRLAPASAHRLARLLDTGQAERLAGRVLGFTENTTGLGIKIKLRGNGQLTDLQVSAVVNCTGPCYDLSEISLPLVVQLRNAGLVKQDNLKLGLLVDADYRLIDSKNQPISGLYYVGPMLKAQYWEAIAVPELRGHTLRLAKHLLRELGCF